jgi:hypothetical protein
LLLVVPHLFALPVLVLWEGLQNHTELNVDVKSIFEGSHAEDCWRCSNISKYFHGNEEGTLKYFNQSSQKQEIERERLLLRVVDKNPEKKKIWSSSHCMLN